MQVSKTDLKSWKFSIEIAADWLIETAQLKSNDISNIRNKKKLQHSYWIGSLKGEYSFARDEWGFFCPVWHTGQALKSWIDVFKVTHSLDYLAAALRGAHFIYRNTILDLNDEDYGLILAYEDYGDLVNISAIFECLDGFFLLGSLFENMSEDQYSLLKKREDLREIPFKDTPEEMGKFYTRFALDATYWTIKKTFIKDEGIFWDNYDPKKRKALCVPHPDEKGRPLLDDAILLKAYKKTQDPVFLETFKQVAKTLIENEYPEGNWIKWWPANKEEGTIHPRHAYWWGRPFIMGYRITHSPSYLKIAMRSANWYLKALRADGAIMRTTYVDFNTDSFGHAASGSACAALLFNDLYNLLEKDETSVKILEEEGINVDEYKNKLTQGAIKALDFCRKMQLTMPEREDMYGVIVEKVLSPQGSDRNPMYIRDLGTIFYIQGVYECFFEGASSD